MDIWVGAAAGESSCYLVLSCSPWLGDDQTTYLPVLTIPSIFSVPIPQDTKEQKEAKVLPTPLLRQLPSLLLSPTHISHGKEGHRNSTWTHDSVLLNSLSTKGNTQLVTGYLQNAQECLYDSLSLR